MRDTSPGGLFTQPRVGWRAHTCPTRVRSGTKGEWSGIGQTGPLGGSGKGGVGEDGQERDAVKDFSERMRRELPGLQNWGEA